MAFEPSPVRACVVIAGLFLLAPEAQAQGTAAPPPPAAAVPAPAGTDAAPAVDPDAAKKEAAKQRFLRGLELSRTQDWDAALVEFLGSREIFPTRAAISNAATTLTTLKRY